MSELKFYYMKYSLNSIKITPVAKNCSCYIPKSGYFYSSFQKWTGGNSPPPPSSLVTRWKYYDSFANLSRLPLWHLIAIFLITFGRLVAV